MLRPAPEVGRPVHRTRRSRRHASSRLASVVGRIPPITCNVLTSPSPGGRCSNTCRGHVAAAEARRPGPRSSARPQIGAHRLGAVVGIENSAIRMSASSARSRARVRLPSAQAPGTPGPVMCPRRRGRDHCRQVERTQTVPAARGVGQQCVGATAGGSSNDLRVATDWQQETALSRGGERWLRHAAPVIAGRQHPPTRSVGQENPLTR